MSEKKEVEEYPSGEATSQEESYDPNKSGASETYDMKDFCPGIRIEAKDFDGKWYPAKVSDVDWTENEILVHFENWNTKFDEWIPMDSSRLRPIQKPVIQQKESIKFSKGEEVMAVWSSNQKYPGVIQAVLANDRYDVLFSDGFLKRLKGHKISKLQGGSVKSEVKTFTDIGTKEERRERKRKINVAELFHINKRPRKKGLVHSKSQDIKTYPVAKPRNKSSVIKKVPSLEGNKADTSSDLDKLTDEKVAPPGVPLLNKALIDSIPAAFEVKYLNGQTETWTKQLYQRSEGRTAGKLDIVIMNPQGRKFRSRNEIMKYCEENGIVYSHEAFDFSAKGRPKSKSIMQTPPQNRTDLSLDDKNKLSFKKSSKKPQQDMIIGSPGMGLIPSHLDVLPQENITNNKVFIGEYEVAIENGKFICPVKTCAKHFRRENLLHMHMKHYHPEFSKYLDYTPSVTDLAYARTVGNLDAGEASSPTPRKSTGSEKMEKLTPKTETARKSTDTPIDGGKDLKKAKLVESRTESRNYLNKVSDISTSLAPTPDESVENSVQTIMNNFNEKEIVTQDNKESSIENITKEPTAAITEGLVRPQNTMRPAKHHRLHNRKKAGRFQSSFSEHLRKRRFISQDRSRSYNRMGRHQQSQHLRQQLQQPQPPQSTISSQLTVDEINSNSLNQPYAMSRYPKPQLNVTNEISGKNSLLTSCKASEKSFQKYEESLETSVKNVCIDLNKNVEVLLKQSNNGIRDNNDYAKRSFLTGLINAQKRKKKALRRRLLKKKKVGHTEGSVAIGSALGGSKVRHTNQPDESETLNNELAQVANDDENDKRSPVSCSLDQSKVYRKEGVKKLSEKERSDFLRERLPLEEDNNCVVSPAVNEVEKSEPRFNYNLKQVDCRSEQMVHNIDLGLEGSVKDNKESVLKKEIISDLPKSYVLLENVYRKDIYRKYVTNLNVGHRGKDENVNVSRYNNENAAQIGGQKRKNLNRKRRRGPVKRVRFDNSITEISKTCEEIEHDWVEEDKLKSEDRKKGLKVMSTGSLSSNKTVDPAEGTEDSKSPLVSETDKIEKLRRNEIINCLCGITEEDGLMIQCDLCLCWQHGHCAGILRELDVPDKYICAICKNPYRARSSMKYLHDQEWLKEGTLPSLSFRSKREDIISQRKTILKRSHDLSGSITLLAQVIHSLRIKVNIAEKKDHPKLWLWAKKWTEKKPSRLKEESEIKEEKPDDHNTSGGSDPKTEETFNQDEKQLPKAPEPEAPIDSAECRLNLLDHLIHYQSLVDARLSCIESLVAELESMQDDVVNDETPERYPRTKATVQMILRDLNTMKKIASI